MEHRNNFISKNEKKRIYSGKKYPSTSYTGEGEIERWYYSYKYKGQKSFWARTEESPQEYENRLVIEKIQEKAKEITIDYKGKDYSQNKIDKLWDEIREKRNKYYDNKTHNEEEKLTKKKATTWKSSQRTKRRKGELEQFKVDKLNKLGMTWNPTKDSWERSFIHFRKRGLTVEIEDWVINQRILFKENKIPKENLIRLKAVGFPFDKSKNEEFKLTWDVMYELSKKLEEKQDDFIKAQMKIKGIPYNK